MWLKGIKDESMKEKCKHCSQLNNLKSTFFVMNTPGHELALPMHQFIFLWNQNIADKPEWFLFMSCRGFCPSHYCKLIIMLKCPLCAKRWEGKCPPLIILQEGKCPNPAKNRGGIVLPTWFEQGGKCPGGEISILFKSISCTRNKHDHQSLSSILCYEEKGPVSYGGGEPKI